MAKMARFDRQEVLNKATNLYATHLPARKHVATKKFTQGIERQNLTFRTRLKRLTRKTICFSKSEELHDKVIGEFISREHYQPL